MQLLNDRLMLFKSLQIFVFVKLCRSEVAKG